MRLTFALPALALALTACGKEDGDDGALAGPTMTAEAIHTNDVTAIDAVTGEAANIAADVDISEDLSNAAGGNDDAPARKTRAAAKTKPSADSAPADSTDAEPAVEASTNNAQ